MVCLHMSDQGQVAHRICMIYGGIADCSHAWDAVSVARLQLSAILYAALTRFKKDL